MTVVNFIQLCSFSLLMAAGQIFFKMAAENAPQMNSLNAVFSLALNPWFIGALALYAFSTLLWVSVLQQVNLSVAYPFVALGFVVIPLASYVLFKEPLNWQYGLGVVLLLVSLKLITSITR